MGPTAVRGDPAPGQPAAQTGPAVRADMHHTRKRRITRTPYSVWTNDLLKLWTMSKRRGPKERLRNVSVLGGKTRLSSISETVFAVICLIG